VKRLCRDEHSSLFALLNIISSLASLKRETYYLRFMASTSIHVNGLSPDLIGCDVVGVDVGQAGDDHGGKFAFAGIQNGLSHSSENLEAESG
jgi:hypothetical protein